MPFLVNDARNVERMNFWKANSNPPGCKYGQRSGPVQYGKPKNKEGVAKCPKVCKNGWARDQNNRCTNPLDDFNVAGLGFQNNDMEEQNDDIDIDFNEILDILGNDNNSEQQNELEIPDGGEEQFEPFIENIDEQQINPNPNLNPNPNPVVIDVGQTNPFSKTPTIEIINNNSRSPFEEIYIGEKTDLYPETTTTFQETNPMNKKAKILLQPSVKITENNFPDFSVASKPIKKRRGVETITQNTKQGFDTVFDYLMEKSEQSEDDKIIVEQFVKYLYAHFLNPPKVPNLYKKPRL